MKQNTVHQTLEEISRKHFGVTSLEKCEKFEVSINQIELALRSAFLSGEKIGYKYGFKDGKNICDCVDKPIEYLNHGLFTV